MKNCFAGRILIVDLTAGQISTQPTQTYADKFLGGRGINVALLYQYVKPWVTPYDPANSLIFGSGTLTGTLAPASCRLSIEAKSPVTGGIGSANSGGAFSAELKYAGYDNLVIKGRARSPVFLWIDNDSVSIKEASHIWGKTTGETEEAILGDLGDNSIQVASIGPAGEYLAKSACIVVNRARIAGRCGLGAVMGSKNLKAVAIRGSQPVDVAHPERFMQAVDNMLHKLNQSQTLSSLRADGLPATSRGLPEARPSRSRNFQDIIDPVKFRKLLPEAYKKYEIRKKSSFACPVGCFRIYNINEGPYSGTLCNGFPANDLINFGARLDLDYAPAVIKAHDLCSELGLDEDSASCSIAWACECFQRGILNINDTGGIELKWGDHQLLMELLKKIAYREGFGDILAEGSMRAAQIIGRGSEDYAMHIKGQDNYEPLRGYRSWALGCVVATRGGTHLRGAAQTDLDLAGRFYKAPPEFRQKWGITGEFERFSYENKVQPVIYCENLKGVADSLGVCWLITSWMGPELLDIEEMTELYSLATGRVISHREMLVIGDRIHNLEKAFNVLHTGFSRRDDYPPRRDMEEPIKGGAFNGDYLARDKWDKLLNEYYELRNWDRASGWQTRKCLEVLDLKNIAEELDKAGRLPY